MSLDSFEVEFFETRELDLGIEMLVVVLDFLEAEDRVMDYVFDGGGRGVGRSGGKSGMSQFIRL